MATRIISQQKAVYVTPWDGSGGSDLKRVDTFSADTDVASAREDVRVFGQLARLGVQYGSEIPCTVSVGYHLNDGTNETLIGLPVGNMASLFLADPQGTELIVGAAVGAEGEDAFSTWTAAGIVGFGNAAVSSYSATFAVGEIPRADVEFSASTMKASAGSTVAGVSVNDLNAPVGGLSATQPSSGNFASLALKPQDISVTISSGADGELISSSTELCVQSATVELPLGRESVECLGSSRPLKYIEFPINATCSITANMQEYSDADLTSLALGTKDAGTCDITIQAAGAIGFELRGAVLDSQSISIGLDDAETIEMTFSAQIGGASNVDVGLFRLS